MSLRVIENSANTVFYERPSAYNIDETRVSRYATSMRIETLMQDLRESGPLVAISRQLGPRCYTVEPFKLEEQQCGQDVYGWTPSAGRNPAAPWSNLMILGARKVGDLAYVYFVLSEDITLDRNTSLRIHRPSILDPRLYIASFQSFHDRVTDIYLARNESVAGFASEKQEYILELCEMELDSILGTNEVRCKEIGQLIFDQVKRDSGSSTYGVTVLRKVHDAVKVQAKDGSLRCQYLERAWNMVGDDTGFWMP